MPKKSSEFCVYVNPYIPTETPVGRLQSPSRLPIVLFLMSNAGCEIIEYSDMIPDNNLTEDQVSLNRINSNITNLISVSLCKYICGSAEL